MTPTWDRHRPTDLLRADCLLGERAIDQLNLAAKEVEPAQSAVHSLALITGQKQPGKPRASFLADRSLTGGRLRLRRFPDLSLVFFDQERLECPSEILIEQVDMREARGVMSEPALDLEDVASFGEESRSDGVAEGVEARPPDSCSLDRDRDRSGRRVR